MFKVGDVVRIRQNNTMSTVAGSNPNRIATISRKISNDIYNLDFEINGDEGGVWASDLILEKTSNEESPQKQAALALPGILEFMEANKIKNMTVNIGNYEITIKNNEK